MTRPYTPSIRDELLKTREKLPLETVAQVKAFVDAILPSVRHITLEDVRARRKEILEIGQKNGITNIRIFSSIVRGETDEISDIDFLVDLEPEHNLLDLAGFMGDVEELLEYNVDVVTSKGIKKRIQERVFREAIPL